MLTFDRKSLLKRVIAFVLVMTLVLSSTADLIPGISLALAEETVASQAEETETNSVGDADREDQSASLDVELSAVIQQVLTVDVSASSDYQESAAEEPQRAEDDTANVSIDNEETRQKAC